MPVAAAVFVGAFVVLMVSLAKGWSQLALLSAAALLGVMVWTAARRQEGTGGRPQDRPWRRQRD